MGRPVSHRGPPGGGGGSVGTPTYTPQNDPHDALIIWNIHKWGKIIFFKTSLPISSGSHQPRSDAEVRSGVKTFLRFAPFLNSPKKTLSISSIDTWGFFSPQNSIAFSKAPRRGERNDHF